MSLLNFEISILTVRILRYFLILGLKNIIQNFNSIGRPMQISKCSMRIRFSSKTLKNSL